MTYLQNQVIQRVAPAATSNFSATMDNTVDPHSDELLKEFFVTIFNDYEKAESVNSLLEEHPGLVNVRSNTRWGWGKSTPLIEACYKGKLLKLVYF